SDEEEEDLKDLLPLSHEAVLKDHDKAITAMTIDRSGMRLATGGFDYKVKCWDFGGMDSRLRPFRTFEPRDGHQVRDLAYSGTGDRLLVAPNGNQAKIYDRDGKELFECVRGDMYLRDMRHTKGHVSALTGCRWNPLDRNAFFTSSLDGTVRLWDVQNKRSHNAIMVHISRSPGGRFGVTAMDVHPEGTSLLTGSNDGSISLWNPRGPYHRPIQVIPKAHTKGEDVTAVSFSPDGGKFLTRSADATLKLWDIRQMRSPVVKPREDLDLAYAEANAVFSPDGTFILAGITSKAQGKQGGGLAILETSSLETVQWLDTKDAGVIKVVWHPLINQIAMGMTDGSCRILYEPSHLSQKGAMLCAARAPRKRPMEDSMVGGQAILTPFASSDSSGHSLRGYRKSQDISKSGKRRQQLPGKPSVWGKEQPDAFGKGAGGKLGSSLTSQIMKGIIKDTTRDVDPREAILKYAED
ncbi:WD40-repeat-containing domain protein, partial [Piptocephalis cylindrospora]